MVRAFVLGVALLAAVGICTVRETSKQIQSRYELERLTRREDEAKKRLERLHADEQTLRSPANLAKAVREKRLNLYALSRTLPGIAEAGGRKTAKTKTRRPGEVAGGAAENGGDGMELAGAF